MNKKKIITLALCLVVLLGVLVFVMNIPEPSENGDTDSLTNSTEETIEEILFSFNTDSVTKIKVTSASVSYTISKTDNGWVCPEKENVVVSQSRMTSLMAELSSVKYADYISTADVNPADCGIDSNADTITFDGELGEVTLIKGNNVPDSELSYVMCSLYDNNIYMIKNESISRMFVSFDEYRSDNLALIDFENIVSIDFKNKNGAFSAVKGEYNLSTGNYYEWRLTSPVELFARDSEIASVLVEPVSKMAVDSYVSDNGNFADFGLAKKDCYVSFVDANGKKQTVYFSDMINNKYYIAINDSKSIYQVSPSSVPFAGISLIDIADRQLYLNMQSNISKVTVVGGGYDYTVDFGTDSTMTVNGNKVSETSDVREIFTSLCGPLADDIYTGATSAELFTMKFILKDSSEVVLSFSEADDRYYNVARNGKTLYRIMKSKIASMVEILDKHK